MTSSTLDRSSFAILLLLPYFKLFRVEVADDFDSLEFGRLRDGLLLAPVELDCFWDASLLAVL